jgi:hypothetical protein
LLDSFISSRRKQLREITYHEEYESQTEGKTVAVQLPQDLTAGGALFQSLYSINRLITVLEEGTVLTLQNHIGYEKKPTMEGMSHSSDILNGVSTLLDLQVTRGPIFREFWRENWPDPEQAANMCSPKEI